MPLIPQRTSFPVTAGQDQSVAPELVDPPVLTRALNMVYDRDGELSKRRGWASEAETVYAGRGLLQPERLAKRGNELLWISEQRTDAFIPRYPVQITSRVVGESVAGTDATWRDRGRICRFNARKLTELNVPLAGARVRQIDTAFAGATKTYSKGLLCVVWQLADTDRIDYAIIDVATNSKIIQGVVASDSDGSPMPVLRKAPLRVIAQRSGSGTDAVWLFNIFYARAVSGLWTNFTQQNVYRRWILATQPSYLSDEAIFQAACGGWDWCITSPSVADHRAFFVHHNYNETTFVVTEFTAASSSLFQMATVTCNITALSNNTFVNNTISCTCDPLGRHVAVVGAIVGRSCGASTANYAAQVNAAAYPSHSLSFYDDVVLSVYPADTYSGDGGLQVGWAGTRVISGVTRRDYWFATWKAYGGSPTSPLPGLWVSELVPGTDLTPQNQRVYGATPFGRHFNYRGQDYQPVVTGVSSDACVIELATFQQRQESFILPHYAGRFLPGEIARAGLPDNYILRRGQNSTVESNYEPGRFFSAFVTVTLDGQSDKIAVMDVDARDPQRFSWCEIGGGTYFAGSIPWVYDGLTGHEIGFAHRPQSDTGEIRGGHPVVTPPGATLAAGSYEIALVWESVDAMGRVTQSAPSFSGTVSVATGETLSVTYSGIGRTSHSYYYPVVYVSNDGGQNYIRSKQQLSVSTSAELTIELDPILLFQSDMPKLQFSDGILENSPPPQARFTAAWQNRVWFANDREVWYSRELIDGESAAFNESLSFQIPANCSGITGLDDRFIIFCEGDAIYWISGDGPTDTGEGGTFSQPQRVPTDFGCIDARSIVMTEKGVCFQSKRGIELLTRDLQPVLISGGIDRLMREERYNEVKCASWDPEAQIARFVLYATVSERAYIIACWHTLYNVWTLSTVPLQIDSDHATIPTGIVNAARRNWMQLGDIAANDASPQCRLAWECKVGIDPYPYLDGSSTTQFEYVGEVETANIKLDGLLGFQRVWRAYVLVKNSSDTTGFVMNYAIDYSPTMTGTERSWTTNSDIQTLNTDGSATHRMAQIHVDKQQCSSIRLLFSDARFNAEVTPDPNHYQGYYTLVGFGIEWGQEPGTGRGHYRSKK